jgi:hypothetical protein
MTQCPSAERINNLESKVVSLPVIWNAVNLALPTMVHLQSVP